MDVEGDDAAGADVLERRGHHARRDRLAGPLAILPRVRKLRDDGGDAVRVALIDGIDGRQQRHQVVVHASRRQRIVDALDDVHVVSPDALADHRFPLAVREAHFLRVANDSLRGPVSLEDDPGERLGQPGRKGAARVARHDAQPASVLWSRPGPPWRRSLLCRQPSFGNWINAAAARSSLERGKNRPRPCVRSACCIEILSDESQLSLTRTPGARHRSSTRASPRNRKNPMLSVTKVSTTLAPCAGSRPAR